jgi:hypothetical protein
MSSNIEVKLDVLNQKGSPALFADSLASRPGASFAGRLFVDTDNPSTGIYRDTGTTWIQVADETGTIPTPTLQTVTTAGNTSNVGISITANGIGIGTTIPASNRLDVHSASGLQATFNGTGVTNAGVQLQSAGVGKWTIQNNYNSAANDFVLTDVLNTVNRLVIKNTGLGTYTGFLNVANIAGSQNIQISGTAPAYTIIDVAGSGYAASLGMATVGNNFIQGSVLGDLCLVSQNTIAGNLKLGVGSTNAAALNISAANRVQIGTSTDAGFLLDVNGTTRISGKTTITGSTTAVSLLAQGQLISSTLIAAANNDVLVGLDINPTFTNGAFTGVSNLAARFQSNVLITANRNNNTELRITNTTAGTSANSQIGAVSDASAIFLQKQSSLYTTYKIINAGDGGIYNTAGDIYLLAEATGKIKFAAGASSTAQMTLFSTGNLGLNTTTDDGTKFRVVGDGKFEGAAGIVQLTLIDTLNNYSLKLYKNASSAYLIENNSASKLSYGYAGNYWATFNGSQKSLALASATSEPTPNASSILDLQTTIKGFLPPRMTTAQKNAIATPATGLVVYDTTLNKLALYTGAAWETVTSI